MLLFATYHVVATHQSLPQAAPPQEPPRAPFGRAVAGAGIVEAETENIAIGSALPGVVLEVHVPVEKVGQQVKKGDPLFLVDNRQLKAQLKYQESSLAAAQAQLRKLEMQPRPEELPASEAAVKVADANLAMQQDVANRYARLKGRDAVSTQDYIQSNLGAQMAHRQLDQAQANLDLLKAGAWKPDLIIAQANVDLARAQIEQTKTDLERALVRAPVDGRVLQVNVRPGEYVGTPPSQALFVLGSVQKLHVRVDIDEHDIPRAHRHFTSAGTAYASPRGEPSQKLPLRFVRVVPYVVPKKSLTGDNTERVDTRVLQVIYQVVRDEPGLFVGMQMDVFLDTNDAPGTRR
jgi:multidrug efflux pump subunit AcrA (membrane-fusion protein)